MMRRQLLLLLVAMSLMLVLALPAAVQARQSWEVRDRAGHVWGKAVTTGTRTADIVKSGGRGRGRRVVRELRGSVRSAAPVGLEMVLSQRRRLLGAHDHSGSLR